MKEHGNPSTDTTANNFSFGVGDDCTPVVEQRNGPCCFEGFSQPLLVLQKLARNSGACWPSGRRLPLQCCGGCGSARIGNEPGRSATRICTLFAVERGASRRNDAVQLAADRSWLQIARFWRPWPIRALYLAHFALLALKARVERMTITCQFKGEICEHAYPCPAESFALAICLPEGQL